MPASTGRIDRRGRRTIAVAVAVVAIGLGLSAVRTALDDHETPPPVPSAAVGTGIEDDVHAARDTLLPLVVEMERLAVGDVDAAEAERWAETARATTAALGDPLADEASYRAIGRRDLLAARVSVHDAAVLLGVAADTAVLAAGVEPPLRGELVLNAMATQEDAVALWDNAVIALQAAGLLGHEDMRLR